MTITEAVRLFVQSLREEGDSFSSSRARGYALNRFIEYMRRENVERLEDVTAELVDGYKAALPLRRVSFTGKRLKPRTVVGMLEAVHHFFTRAKERGWINHNPAVRILWGAPPRYNALPRCLTPGEMEKVLAAPDVTTPVGIRDRTVLELMYSTGMRPGEVAKLELSDVDMEAGRLRVKSVDKSLAREVPLEGAAREWLARYLNEVRPVWLARSVEGRVRKGRYGQVRAGRREKAVFLGPRCGDVMREINVEGLVSGAIRPVNPHVRFTAVAIRCACAARRMREGATLDDLHAFFGYPKLHETEICVRIAAGNGGV